MAHRPANRSRLRSCVAALVVLSTFAPISQAANRKVVTKKSTKPTVKQLAEPFAEVDNDRWGYAISIPRALALDPRSIDDMRTYISSDAGFRVTVAAANEIQPPATLAAALRARIGLLAEKKHQVMGSKVTAVGYSISGTLTDGRPFVERFERQQDYAVTLAIDYDPAQAQRWAPVAQRVVASLKVAS